MLNSLVGGPSHSLAIKRQNEAIDIMKKYIEEKTETRRINELKTKYHVGNLDSLSVCEDCGEMAMVTYMAGGYRCRECGAGEMCF